MTSRRLAALLLLVLVAGPLGGGTASGTTVSGSSAVTPRAASAATTYQHQAIRNTNAIRVNRDRVAVRRHSCLQAKAQAQARRMARQQRMFHQDLGRVLRDCGLSRASENVAYGYPDGRSVVREGWMQSPPHKRNLLRGSHRLIGLAAVKGGGRWYVAQVFGSR